MVLRRSDNISLEVPDGSFLAIIWSERIGKSTPAAARINRLVEPTEGRILWNEVDITPAVTTSCVRIRRRIGI